MTNQQVLDQLQLASQKIFVATQKIRDLDLDSADDLDKVNILADLFHADELIFDLKRDLQRHEL